MTRHAALCFCCSEKPFTTCCQPIIANHGLATTPLMLMRSRYTAYVLENEEHILSTWHPSTRPETLSLANSPVKWLGLVIVEAEDDIQQSDTGTVEFAARYIERDQLCTLHEVSRFIHEDGLWYYRAGDAKTTQKKIGRNSNCPCGSGKKFKRCCLNR